MRTGSRSFLLSLALLVVAFTQAAAGTPGKYENCLAPEHVQASVPALHPFRLALQPQMIVEGINNEGWIVGRWTDSAGRPHWFLMNPFMPAFSDVAMHGMGHAQGVIINDTGDIRTSSTPGS